MLPAIIQSMKMRHRRDLKRLFSPVLCFEGEKIRLHSSCQMLVFHVSKMYTGTRTLGEWQKEMLFFDVA